MSTTLATRLSRLEKKAQIDDPLQLLTDEELDEAIRLIDARIAAEVGMPVADYARQLQDGHAAPEELSAADVQRFVTSIIASRSASGVHDGR